MINKQTARVRRAKRSRAKMRELGVYRLSVHRTPRHIYAQVISPAGDRVLASASTLDKELRSGSTGLGHGQQIGAAQAVLLALLLVKGVVEVGSPQLPFGALAGHEAGVDGGHVGGHFILGVDG